MTPEEPGQAAESVRDQFRDAARMTSEFTKETWEMAKDVAGQAMNKMTGGQSSSDEGFGRMRGEDAPMRSGEMGGMKKEGGEPMGWWVASK